LPPVQGALGQILHRFGPVVTSGPKVTLRNAFYINELFGAFCYKQLKSCFC